MSNKIFLTLPVTNLQKSVEFFKAFGFELNLQFSDDTAACIAINDSTSVMLETHDKFRQFALSCDSRQRVNDIAAKALAAGGTTYDKPEDLSFMFSHSFVDLDGHGWGVLHLSA